jgi:dihydroorotase
VTCEVTPHHLLVHDDLFDDYRADGKVNPPLRDTSDSSALRAGVRDGSIDVFATDHAPHGMDEKAQLLSAAPVGFTGLEIALGAYAHALPDLPLDRFIACFSTNPARILHLPGGSLRLGAPADITIFGERPWIVDAKSFQSKGKNTPFDGWSFARRAIVTIVDGRIVYQNGEILTTRRTIHA